ncbi:MAG: phosphoenolpyruvate--protein phosphotransferase [Candidatus Cloacimonetes bacterium]|nr:phosphoenolpyruvate--protein phosphotransferase [Candidatus Cloacimonadota bacterium]
MKILNGYPIAPGLSAGKAAILQKVPYHVSSEGIDNTTVDNHIDRFYKALDKSIAELEFLSSLLESDAKEEREILLSHKEMLKDKVFADETITKIKNDLISAEYSVHSYFEKLINHFSQIDDDYLAQRKEDITDIRNRIIRNLRDREDKSADWRIKNKIVVVEEITPSLVINIKNHNALGIITERGAPNSHSAIIARSIGVPVVFDIKHVLHEIHNNDYIILNGTSGSVIVQPKAKQIDDYKEEKKREAKLYAEKIKLSKLQTITKDNQIIHLMGNIEFPEEGKKIELQYADGIGLFRTEFLYFNENSFPPAQKQFEVYRNLIDYLPENVPIYIRTFDVGGDKLSKEFGLDKELNPYLGCRGIRFLLKFPKIFKGQLKGILQASAYGNLKIMLPMISTIDEVVKAKKVINEVKNSLRKDNITFNHNIEIGIMIEVPSAALLACQLAEVSDFFSIGTNDLTQYVLAADRNNETLTAEFNYFHPAVLQLIEMTINAAIEKGIHVSLCGEMAGDTIAIPLLLGMGLKIFSVNANNILTTKKQIRSYNLHELQNKYNEMKLKSSEEIKKYYKSLIKPL